MKRLVEEIIDYLLTLPEGTELSTGEVLVRLYGQQRQENGKYLIHGRLYDYMDFIELDCRVYRQAKRHGLLLDDSKYAGTVTGLPYDVPYVVWRRK